MVSEKIVVDEIPGTLILYSDGSVERPDTSFVPAGFDAEYEVHTKDIVIDPKTGVNVRIYLPNTKGRARRAPRLPVVLFFHGGGWCLRSPSSPQHNHFCTRMAAKTSSIWISVGYRLAPEHKLPTAYQDCFTALSWLRFQSLLLLFQQQERENLPDLLTSVANGFDDTVSIPDDWLALHADFSRCFLLGDSAGGTNVYYVAAQAASSWPAMSKTPKMSRGMQHNKDSIQSSCPNVPVVEISRGPQHNKDSVQSPRPNVPMVEISRGPQHAKDSVESPSSNLPVLEMSSEPQQAKYFAKSPGQIDLSMLKTSRGPEHAGDFIQSPRRNNLPLLEMQSRGPQQDKDFIKSPRVPQHNRDSIESPGRTVPVPERGPQHDRDFVESPGRTVPVLERGPQHDRDSVESPGHTVPIPGISRGPQQNGDFVESPRYKYHFSLNPMRILGIVMLHPAILPRRPTKGALMEKNERLTEARGDAFFRMAMPTGSQYGDPLVNPMSADATFKLSEVALPPSLIAVAQGDLLHDNIVEFCEAIKNGKQKDVEVVVTPGEGHTFFLHKPHSTHTQNLEERVGHFMKRLAFPARPPPSPRSVSESNMLSSYQERRSTSNPKIVQVAI